MFRHPEGQRRKRFRRLDAEVVLGYIRTGIHPSVQHVHERRVHPVRMVHRIHGSRPMVSRAGDHDHIEQDPVRRLGGSDVQRDNQDRRIIGQHDIRSRRRPDHRRRSRRSGSARYDLQSDEGGRIPEDQYQVRTVRVPLRRRQVVRSNRQEHIDLGRLAHSERLFLWGVHFFGIPYEARGPHRRSHDEDQGIQRELRRPRRPSSQMVCGHPRFG